MRKSKQVTKLLYSI